MMARFARDCQDAFRDVVWKLQFTLGPDTGKSLFEAAYFAQRIHRTNRLEILQRTWHFVLVFIRGP